MFRTLMPRRNCTRAYITNARLKPITARPFCCVHHIIYIYIRIHIYISVYNYSTVKLSWKKNGFFSKIYRPEDAFPLSECLNKVVWLRMPPSVSLRNRRDWTGATRLITEIIIGHCTRTSNGVRRNFFEQRIAGGE